MGKFALALAMFAGLLLSGCGYNNIQSTDEQTKAAWSEVLNQYQRRADLIPNLVKTVQGYAAQEQTVLLGVTQARAKVGSIQATPELVNDPAAPGEARFLAGEVLFASDSAFLSRTDPARLAEVYAEALVNNYTGIANSWGLLSAADDPGPVGQRFLQLGGAAIPALSRLLANPAIPAHYVGSEEATVGNGYRFRVKDFAAFYLSKIKGLPLLLPREPGDRDRAITQLKALLHA